MRTEHQRVRHPIQKAWPTRRLTYWDFTARLLAKTRKAESAGSDQASIRGHGMKRVLEGSFLEALFRTREVRLKSALEGIGNAVKLMWLIS